MDIELLRQADLVLSRCGRPEAPRADLAAVYIPKSFLVQAVFPAATASPDQTITREITGDTFWCLRAIQILANAGTAINWQVVKPDGRFLINELQDITQVNGYGSYRYNFNKELRCDPGSKLQVTFSVFNTTNQQPAALLFDGAYEYLINRGAGRICPNQELAARMPRYFGDRRENIMAPAWQQGLAHYTPPGFYDEEQIYSVSRPTLISVTSPITTATQQIQIPPSEQFHIRRFLFDVTADPGVMSGTFLAKIRNGSGYAFTDDYFDVARYIGSSPMPRNWIIEPEDTVYIDLQLVDQTGVGNMSFQTHIDGFRRRRR